MCSFLGHRLIHWVEIIEVLEMDTITYGKYKGAKLVWVAEYDPYYILDLNAIDKELFHQEIVDIADAARQIHEYEKDHHSYQCT